MRSHRLLRIENSKLTLQIICFHIITLLFFSSGRSDEISANQLEKEQYVDIPNTENISLWIGNDNPFNRVHKAIALLSSEFTNGNISRCTAFKVCDGFYMTAAHCIVNDSGGLASRIRAYSRFIDGDLADVKPLKLEVTNMRNFEWDFAVLKSTDSDENPILPIASIELSYRNPLFIVHHPRSTPPEHMRISRDKCGTISSVNTGEGLDQKQLFAEIVHPFRQATSLDTTAIADRTLRFRHTCDTLEGSSGAPINDYNGNVVGIHVDYQRGQTDDNFGVPFSAFSTLVPDIFECNLSEQTLPSSQFYTATQITESVRLNAKLETEKISERTELEICLENSLLVNSEENMRSLRISCFEAAK